MDACHAALQATIPVRMDGFGTGLPLLHRSGRSSTVVPVRSCQVGSRQGFGETGEDEGAPGPPALSETPQIAQTPKTP